MGIESRAKTEWVPVGAYDVRTDADGLVIAKVLVGTKTQNQHDGVPAKAWVYDKYIGEYVTPHKAKDAAERWLKLGRPTK